MQARSTGRLVALVLLSGVAGVVLFAALRQGGSGAGAGSRPAQGLVEMGPPPAASRTVTDPGTGGSVQDLVSLARQGVWTRVDPVTNSVAFRMTWDRLDPLEAGRFEVTSPRAWVYESGSEIEMSAQRGTLVWPSREQEPQSGTLSGGVVVTARQLDDSADELPAEALDRGRPEQGSADQVSLKTPTLAFEMALGEFRGEESVEISGPGLEARGEGFVVRLTGDKVRPLGMLRVERGGSVRYDPAEARKAAIPREPKSGRRTEDRGPRAGAPGLVTDYQARVSGKVRVSAGARSLSGELATLWARTRDGRLDAGRVSGFDPAPGSKSRPGDTQRTQDEAPSDDPIVMTWRGVLEVAPREGEMAELAHDDLFVRVDGEPDEPVRVRDEGSGGVVLATTLAYGATRRALLAEGTQGRELSMSLPELADALGQRLVIDLTSGEGAFEGPGSIEAAAAAAHQSRPRARGVRWTERADFGLDVSGGPVGSTDPILKEVRFAGDVEAHDGEACLKGQMVHATFEREQGSGVLEGSAALAGKPGLRRLQVRGAAHATDARGATLDAQDVDVMFEPGGAGADPTPVLAVARGGVRAARPGEALSAQSVQATLGRDDQGRVALRALEALDGVRVDVALKGASPQGEGALTIDAQRLSADVASGVIDLVGEPTVLARRASDGAAQIRGGSARIESAAGRRGLTVFGPGEATYDAPRGIGEREADMPADSAAGDRVRVSWAGSLAYDDALGRAEVLGGVEANLSRGALERHVARGERLVVGITPAPEGSPAPARRDLVSALVQGGERPAELELRRLGALPDGAAPGSDAPLEGLAVLRGPWIAMDGSASRLRVDGAGVLLLEDRRPAEAAAGGAASDELRLAPSGARGTTLCEWDSEMRLDRVSGVGSVVGNVRVRHRDAESARIAQVECDALTLVTREDASPEQGMTLTSVEAAGSVRALYAGVVLEGASLVYDAPGRTLRVLGDASRAASAYDQASGRSATASEVIVDLASGDWRAIGAGTITSPR